VLRDAGGVVEQNQGRCMKFDPNKAWVIGQDTKAGHQYFTGKMHPISPDSWTPNMSKAICLTWNQAVNLRESVLAYTWSASPKIKRSK